MSKIAFNSTIGDTNTITVSSPVGTANRSLILPDKNGTLAVTSDIVSGLRPTSIKTSGYTALTNELVRVDSTSAPFTVTLPSGPSDGDMVGVLDVVNQCANNAVLMASAGGKTVEGDATGLSVNIAGAYVVLMYNSVMTNWKLQATPNNSSGSGLARSGANTDITSLAPSGGTLTVTGNTLIKTSTGGDGLTFNATSGVLSLANGQIQFPATQVPSAGVNVLDDYEEGTFIATLTASITGPTAPVTSTAYYTKIGRLVAIACAFYAVSTVGSSGNVLITGLPFTNSALMYATGSCGTIALGTAVSTAYITKSESQIRLYNSVTLDAIPMVATTGVYVQCGITYFV